MKKLPLLLLTFLSYQIGYALPIGNPAEGSLFLDGMWWESYCGRPCDPCENFYDIWSLRIGFYGDYIFDRKLEVASGSVKPDVDRTEIYTNALYLVFNIYDRIDLFGTLGESRIKITADSRIWDSPGHSTTEGLKGELQLESELSWSVGARAVVLGCNNFALGLEGQFYQTNPDLTYLVLYDTGGITHFDDEFDTHYWEWQVGFAASYTFALDSPRLSMIPYFGVKWSRSHFDMDDIRVNELRLFDLQSKRLWGYAVGTTATLCDAVGVTVEGRFGDEKAFFVTSQFRF